MAYPGLLGGDPNMATTGLLDIPSIRQQAGFQGLAALGAALAQSGQLRPALSPGVSPGAALASFGPAYQQAYMGGIQQSLGNANLQSLQSYADPNSPLMQSLTPQQRAIIQATPPDQRGAVFARILGMPRVWTAADQAAAEASNPAFAATRNVPGMVTDRGFAAIPNPTLAGATAAATAGGTAAGELPYAAPLAAARAGGTAAGTPYQLEPNREVAPPGSPLHPMTPVGRATPTAAPPQQDNGMPPDRELTAADFSGVPPAEAQAMADSANRQRQARINPSPPGRVSGQPNFARTPQGTVAPTTPLPGTPAAAAATGAVTGRQHYIDNTIVPAINGGVGVIQTTQQMRQLLTDPQLQTGPGAGMRNTAAELFRTWGGETGRSLADRIQSPSFQGLESISSRTVLDQLGGSLGTGISNADRDFISRTVPNPFQSRETLERFIGLVQDRALSNIQTAHNSYTRSVPGYSADSDPVTQHLQERLRDAGIDPSRISQARRQGNQPQDMPRQAEPVAVPVTREGQIDLSGLTHGQQYRSPGGALAYWNADAMQFQAAQPGPRRARPNR